jgi:hypothetical protein
MNSKPGGMKNLEIILSPGLLRPDIPSLKNPASTEVDGGPETGGCVTPGDEVGRSLVAVPSTPGASWALRGKIVLPVGSATIRSKDTDWPSREEGATIVRAVKPASIWLLTSHWTPINLYPSGMK